MNKISIDRAAIAHITDKAVLINLPEGWKFWHPRRLTYQHPDDPALFIIGYYNTPGADSFQEANRKITAKIIISWAAIARVNKGHYTGETGYLAPFTGGTKSATSFKTRQRAGKHVPDHLEPVENLLPHASLIR